MHKLERFMQDIQFNSKTLFNDGAPVSSQLIFPGAILEHMMV